METAGFWIRAAAFLVDIVILSLLQRLLHVPPRSAWLVFAINSAYFFFFFWLMKGQTLGKKLFGLKVIRSDGGEMEPLRALVRAMFYALDELLMGLGFLLALGRERKALHDWVLGTRVVRLAALQPTLPTGDAPGT